MVKATRNLAASVRATLLNLARYNVRMAQRLTKAQTERRVFEYLAPLAGLEVAPNSIQQSDPPSPDIECQVTGLGALAVELVALDHEETRTRLSNMFSTEEAWHRALSRRSSAEQTTLRAECNDAFLGLSFDENAGNRMRANAMTAIQDRLLVRPHGYFGKVFTASDLPSGLRDAVVHRGHVTNGPRISAPSAGSWHPPQINMIQDKLTDKRYRTAAPLELFAYSTHDEPDGAIGMLDQIDSCVRAHLPGSLFRRVRVFNFAFGSHIYTFPP